MQSPPLPPEVLSFEAVILNALGDDNAVRQSAERSLQQSRQQHPDAYITSLTLLLHAPRTAPVRLFCAVMLRQALSLSVFSEALASARSPSHSPRDNGAPSSPDSAELDAGKQLYERLSGSTLSHLQSCLLHLFEVETDASVRKKVVDLICTLCVRLLAGDEGWPDFLRVFLAACASANPQHRLSVLDCIQAVFMDCNSTSFQAHLATIRSVIVSSITSSDATFRLSALRALISVLMGLDSEQLTQIRDTVPLMFAALERAYRERAGDQANDDLLISGTSVLSELASTRATLLRPHLSPVVRMMAAMVRDDTLEERARRSAMEFLIVLAEDGKGMVRKLAEFPTTVIPLSFVLMMELDEDSSVWGARDDDDDEDDDEGRENYRMGAESVGRLAEALQGKIYAAVALPLLHAHITHSEWRHRHAAMVQLEKMVQAIDSTLEPLLPTFVQLVTPHTRDPHPRVAHAALHCLAQLTVSYSPSFQTSFHSTVLPAFIDILRPDCHHRLITSACTGIIEFCREVESSVIEAYGQAVLQKLEGLISHPSLAVKESVISVISAVSLALGDAFTPFYPVLYPFVKQLVLTCNSKEVLRLRAKAIECIGTIAEAVGPTHFRPDEANSVMQTLMSIKTADMASDDHTLSYLVAAEARIAKALGAGFTPYLPHVIPPLLKSAAITDEYAILGEDDDSGLSQRPGYETTTVDIRGGGTMRITLNTSMFDEKAMAMNMLYQYAETLQGAFLPYVNATADVVIPNVGYKFHESVRIAAVSACPALIKCTAQGLQEGKERDTAVRALWSRMLPQLLECTKKELHLDNLCGILDAMADGVKDMQCEMEEGEVELLCKELKEMSAESVKRMEGREERREQPDFDEEEEQVIAEENESEDEFLGYVYQLIAALITCNKAGFLPHYHQHLHPFFAHLLPHSNPSLVTTALCVIAQVVNDVPLPQNLQHQYCDALFPKALQHSLSPSLDLRQSAVFAIGACAHCLGLGFAPVMMEALRVLKEAIQSENSRQEEMAPATDNAIGALEKVVTACRRCLSEEQRRSLLGDWVDALPCIADEAEAVQVHSRLLHYIEQEDDAVLGVRGERVEKLYLTLASLLDSDLVPDDATQRIGGIFTRWHSRMAKAEWERLFSKLDDEDRQSVIKAMEAAR